MVGKESVLNVIGKKPIKKTLNELKHAGLNLLGKLKNVYDIVALGSILFTILFLYSQCNKKNDLTYIEEKIKVKDREIVEIKKELKVKPVIKHLSDDEIVKFWNNRLTNKK